MEFYAPSKKSLADQNAFFTGGLINHCASETLILHESGVNTKWYTLTSRQMMKITEGCVKILLAKLDQINNPSHYLKVEEHVISAGQKEVAVHVPKGYAVNFKAIIPGSRLEIRYSDIKGETIPAKVTFDKDRWYFDSFF